MSKTVTLTIKVEMSGDGTDNEYSVTHTNTNAHGMRGPENVTLSAGFNAQTTPTDATTPPLFALVVPSSTSTNTKIAKGVTGDQGIASGSPWTNQPAIFALGSASVWGITSTAGEVVAITYF